MFLAGAATAGLVGFGLGGAFAFAIVWYILVIIGDWKILEKAGKPGWFSLIPFVNLYQEYDLCWNGSMGVVYMLALWGSNFLSNGSDTESAGFTAIIAGVLGLIALILRIIQSHKLSKAFGHGIGFTLFLIVFERIGRVILGFGSSEYEGQQ